MKTLQLKDAKEHFSAVAQRAAEGSPQMIIKDGKPFVIVGVKAWEQIKAPNRSLLEVLRSCLADFNGVADRAE